MPFILTCIYTVFVFVRPQELIPELREVPLLQIVGGANILLIIPRVFSSEIKKNEIIFNLNLFLLVVIISSMFNFGAWGIKNVFNDFIPSIILCYSLFYSLHNFIYIRRYLLVLLYCFLFLVVNGCIQYFTGFNLAGLTMSQETRIQGFGIFADPNDLAQALVVSIPIIFYLLKTVEKIKLKFLYLIILIWTVFTISLTDSRGGFLGLFAVLFLNIRKKIGMLWSSILIGFGSLSILLYSSTRLSTISTGEESAHGRIEAWYQGILMLRENPLLGVGYGRWGEFHYLTAHNSFVYCFAETGLLGYFFYISLFFVSIKQIKLIAAPLRLGNSMTILLESMLIGWVVCAFFLTRTFSPLLYIILGIIAAFIQNSQILNNDDYKRTPILPRFYIEIGSIILIFCIIKVGL